MGEGNQGVCRQGTIQRTRLAEAQPLMFAKHKSFISDTVQIEIELGSRFLVSEGNTD